MIILVFTGFYICINIKSDLKKIIFILFKNKRMKKILLSLSFFLVSFFLYSQETCTVKDNTINEVYVGECKDGLANGNGIAKGINQYEGEFKNGLPHGDGIMLYSDKTKFIGKFKNGLKHGKGKLYDQDEGVTLNGYWKKDEFVREDTSEDYKVLINNSVPRYQIRKLNNDYNKVQISVKHSGTYIPLSINNVSVTTGNLSFNNSSAIIENIDFSLFQCELTYSAPSTFNNTNQIVEFKFKIFKEGNWIVEINH